MSHKAKLIVGWREAVDLPDLNIQGIKAKIDTGARTSTLHSFRTELYRERNKDWVRFWVHPLQGSNRKTVICAAPLLDERVITDSGGHQERRYVIETLIRMGPYEWPIECTLTNRSNLQFRMLLGRTAIAGRFLADPEQSYLLGVKKKTKRGRP